MDKHEVTRTELVGWTGTRIRELQRSTRREISETVRRQECVREKQKEQLNSLDEADFVRDVDKSSYLIEIGGDKPCYQQLFCWLHLSL